MSAAFAYPLGKEIFEEIFGEFSKKILEQGKLKKCQISNDFWFRL